MERVINPPLALHRGQLALIIPPLSVPGSSSAPLASKQHIKPSYRWIRGAAENKRPFMSSQCKPTAVICSVILAICEPNASRSLTAVC
ncbi:hypothetical protein QQF64_007533 [Cirrhinus molitorella]|uniref:Uncharacterized protein n=1 Tax=Cirrhinus molitorella TaxID=172907 RepID=A0ABR3MB21_9TELE